MAAMDHDFPDMMDEQESLVQSADSAEGPFPRAGWQVLLEVEFAKQNALLRDVGLQMISTVKETLKEELAGKHSLGARGIRHVRTDAEMPRGLSTVVSSEADSLGVQSLPLGMKFQPSTASRSASRDPPVTTTAPPEKNVSSTNSWDSIYQHRDFRASRRKAQAAAKKISELRGGASSLGLVGEMDDPKLSESWSLRTVRSSAFRAGVPIVILTNLILLGVEVDMSAQLPPNAQIEAFQVANIIIVCFFFGEILLKLHAYGCKMMYFGKDRWWNWSDLLIFSMSVFEIVGEAMASVVFASQMDPTQLRTMRFLRMARALRGVRVLRLLQYLSALRTIVFSIVSTMGSVFWTSLLLVILFYLFGVLNTQIATDHCRALTHAEVPQKCDPELMRFWSSVPQAMLTLFLSITNGVSWDDCLQPLWDVSRVALVSLIVYIVITVFAVLNTVTGVFCNMAIESARADKDMATMRQMQKHEAQVDALRGVFEEINPDGMGVISLEELKEALKQEKLRSFMHSMDIATDDIVTLFMVIDADGSGDITLDEFVYGCMNLAGPAKQLQVARMGYENTIIRKELKALRVDLRKLRQYIAALENNHVHSLGGGRAAPLENYPSVRV
ncbi:Scn5a [Symbiodinium microadriaticum]|nr:Scn5a [Symbiodinium microadriaticum]CAE7670450.1 Scn5a [Symbiodinium sp. KB8]